MNKTFESGKKEKLEIICRDDEIEFINHLDQDKNEIYKYSEIKDVKFNKGKTLWIGTIITWFIDIFANITIGKKYRKNRNIEILTKNERLTIWLSKADLKNAEKVVEIINLKISSHNSKL